MSSLLEITIHLVHCLRLINQMRYVHPGCNSKTVHVCFLSHINVLLISFALTEEILTLSGLIPRTAGDKTYTLMFNASPERVKHSFAYK